MAAARCFERAASLTIPGMAIAQLEAVAREYPGLSSAEAAERAQAGGANRMAGSASRSYWRIFVDNAFPAANIALIAVAIALIALGLYIDALLTAGLVVGNIVVGVFQEARAKRQLDRIAVLARAQATVIRDGEARDIDPDEIVQGDVLVVAPGEQVQADGTVLVADNCAFDESLLTGESDLVRKSEGDTIYSGSFCMSGRAVFRCDVTGREGFANQITEKARAFRVVRTPLQREVGWVMWGMAVFVALLGAEVLVSFHGIYGRLPLVETTRASAVIVALIPQGLWVMVTVTYALAIVRLSPRGTLVQRLNAVESMSHINVLCLDKTGTITTNALALESLHALEASDEDARRQLGAFCASASVPNRTDETIAKALEGEGAPFTEEVQFSSQRKWSARAFDASAMHGLYVLGAPEMLMTHVRPIEGADELVRGWLDQGLRVLLFARAGDADAISWEADEPHLPDGLQPLCFVVLRDELRPGARETMEDFGEIGIGVKIISGDNPATVSALARAAGVAGAERAISGSDLGETEDQRFDELVRDTTVFGRIVPAQKARIVEALQRQGRYVAMIGDGVNDVPALKRAQVSISMRAASPVTRSIADMILLDDSFTSLPDAFAEGRRIRKGMEAIVRLFLVRTFAVGLMIFGVALLQSEFPLTPRHTAIMSAVTVGIPSLFIAAWAPPKPTRTYLIPTAAAFVVPASIALAFVSVVVFKYAISAESIEVGRTMLTSVASLAGVLLIPYAAEVRAEWLTVRGFVSSHRMAALTVLMLATYVVAFTVPPFRHFYELSGLSLLQGGVVAVGVVFWVLLLAGWWRLQQRAIARGLVPAELVPE